MAEPENYWELPDGLEPHEEDRHSGKLWFFTVSVSLFHVNLSCGLQIKPRVEFIVTAVFYGQQAIVLGIVLAKVSGC